MTQANLFSTALHAAIEARNDPSFNVILQSTGLDLEIVNNAGCIVLELALRNALPTEDAFDAESFPSQLIKRGASVDAVDSTSGNTSDVTATSENIALSITCRTLHVVCLRLKRV